MAQKPLLTVGSLNMDQIVQVPRLPVMGETLLGAGSLLLVPGGKGANQAVAMARMGVPVKMAGRVGSDPFGAHLLRALQEDQIDTSLVVVDQQAASGVAFIFLSPEGENAIVVASGANMRVGEDAQQMEAIRKSLPEMSALVLQMEIPSETVTELVVAGKQAGISVMLNLAPARALPLETLRQLDVLLVNETEAVFLRDALAGSQQPGPAVRNLADASALASSLHDQGIATVVITLGARGAMLASQGEKFHIATPAVQVVDTTAAGDCFAGAFMAALTEGQELAGALRFAVFASALKVTKLGAQSGLPTRAEVEAWLRSV